MVEYCEVSEERMLSILRDLNQLEMEFCDGNPDDSIFTEFSAYLEFLKTRFVQENKFEKIYFLPVPAEMQSMISRGMVQLEEAYAIHSNSNISPLKQFNFHYKKLHLMNCYEAVWIFEGKAQFFLGEEVIPLEQGDLLIHPPQIPYELRMEKNGIGISFVLRNRYIQNRYNHLFSGNIDALNFFEHTDNQPPYLLFHAAPGRNRINSLVLQLLIEYLWGEKHQRPIMDRYFEILLYQVRKASETISEESGSSSSMQNCYQKILTYVHDNYREATLGKASEELNFSQQYIARVFRKMRGESFHQYVEREKLKRVKEYLLETGYSVEVIAELAGYASGSYLSKIFHKVEGVTISEFRKRKVP